MNKNLFTFFLLLNIPFLFYAQSTRGNNKTDHENQTMISLENLSNDMGQGAFFKTPAATTNTQTMGSPYFLDDYGEIAIIRNGQESVFKNARINFYGDVVEIKIRNQLYAAYFDEVESLTVNLNGTVYFFKKYKNDLGQDKIYKAEKINDNITVLTDIDIRLIQPTYKAEIAKGDKFAKYIRLENNFILTSDNTFQKVSKPKHLSLFFNRKRVKLEWSKFNYCDLRTDECLKSVLRSLSL